MLKRVEIKLAFIIIFFFRLCIERNDRQKGRRDVIMH